MSAGIVPVRILSSQPPSAPSPRPALNDVSSSFRFSASQKSTGPLDFTGIRRQGALAGIRNTHHFQRSLDRQLRAILPGGANFEVRKELSDIITGMITSSGKIYRKDLRDTLLSKSIGVGRIMTAGQRDKLLNKLNILQR